jgi:hypothetical protein
MPELLHGDQPGETIEYRSVRFPNRLSASQFGRDISRNLDNWPKSSTRNDTPARTSLRLSVIVPTKDSCTDSITSFSCAVSMQPIAFGFI